MEQTVTTAQVAIFAHHRAAAVAKLEKLAKKAAKYGQSITWTERPFTETVKRGRWDDEKIEVQLHKIEFTVTGDAPRVGEYRFLASLEQAPGGVLVSGIREAEIGALGYEWDGRCDHCGSNRYRKQAFVVEGPDGSRKIVGKSCLRDHLGTDIPGNMLNAFTFDDIAGMGADEEEGGWGGYGRWEESTLGVIATARAAIALYGWRPSSFEGMTTSTYVNLVYSPPSRDHKGRVVHDEERQAIRTELRERGEHYYETARKVIDWGQALQPRGDYEHNLKVALNADIVIGKTFALVVSAAAAYDRQVAREDEAKKRREAEEARLASMPKSFHLGQPGDKLSAAVTIEQRRVLPDYGFGCSMLYVMRADDGALLSWKTSTDPRVNGKPTEVGERYRIAFTVKSHAEFRDTPETRVARVKFEALLEQAA